MPRSVPAPDVDIRPGLARRLIRAQHPDLAHLPLRALGSGWDTVVLRLGRDLTVRLPRRALGAQALASERWLTRLAPALPLATPEPVRAGAPDEGYPYPWSICRYVPGRALGAQELAGAGGLRAAAALAGFLGALHVPAPPDAPRNPCRVDLARRAQHFEEALAHVPAAQSAPAMRAWQRAVRAPAHDGPPCWVHGDLHGLNVLVSRGSISGVIDFGDLGAGDPATDLACAWLLLDLPARRQVRELLEVEPATWERGRGWALYLSVMFLAHSSESALNRAIGLRGLAALL